MSNGNELVDLSKNLSPEDLQYYNDLAKQDNDAPQKKLPILKINYDADSKYPTGAWVVGQTKKDDKIVEEGILVDKFVILKIRNQYNLYDDEDATKNCYSPIHKKFDVVQGSKYKVNCGKTCQYKINGDCKASKVVFGIAITPEGVKHDCVTYFRGVNYMPFEEYTAEVTKVEIDVGGKKSIVNVPIYSIVNKLESKSDKKGTIKFFHAILTRLQILKREAVDKLKEQAEQLEADLGRNVKVAEVVSPQNEETTVAPAVSRETVMEVTAPEKKTVIEVQQGESLDSLF